MSTLNDKIAYLNETKTGIKNALIEKGVEVSDSDTFRSYVDKIQSISASSDTVVDFNVSVTELNDWSLSYNNKTETVTIPHTYNIEDCTKSSIYRGTGSYTTTFTGLAGDTYILFFEQVIQSCIVKLNDVVVNNTHSGFAPFYIVLNEGIITGENTVEVICDNSINYDRIPLSADFSFCGGITGKCNIMNIKGACFSPVKYGNERLHVVVDEVTDAYAKFKVEYGILVQNIKDAMNVSVKIELLDANGTVVLSKDKSIRLYDIDTINDTQDFYEEFYLSDPHLWNSIEDPYLYNVKMSLSYNEEVRDTASTNYGFRYFYSDIDTGFYLNGSEYKLRGVSLHQDCAKHAFALTDEDIDTKIKDITDLGCNFVRTAHYPHLMRELNKLEELGIVIEEEIPWVNHCGTNATDAYHECIVHQAKEMVEQLYNCTSIVYWGMHNEMGGEHPPIGNKQGALDLTKLVPWSNNLYLMIRGLDPSRYVGYASNRTDLASKGLQSDYWSFNVYGGWYQPNELTRFNSYATVYKNGKKFSYGASEYGAGGNPYQHSNDWRTATDTGSGGPNHYEEYHTFIHEIHLDYIIQTPTLGFTSTWVMYDFPAYYRTEGGLTGINDKGLITRDGVKKDAFYLYKTYWSKTPFCYITEKRWDERDTDTITIKAYCKNAATVKLFRNDVELQSMSEATGTINGIIYTFDPVRFLDQTDTFVVKCYNEDSEVIAEDTATWKTTGNYMNEADFIDIVPSIAYFENSVENITGSFTITHNTAFNLEYDESVLTVATVNTIDVTNVTYSMISDGSLDKQVFLIKAMSTDPEPVLLGEFTIVRKAAVKVNEIEYIENNASNNYFKLGITPKANTKIEAVFGITPVTTAVTEQLFGSRTSSTSSDKFSLYYKVIPTNPESTKCEMNAMFDGVSTATGSTNIRKSYPENGILNISMDSTGIIVNGTVYPYTGTPSFTSSNYEFYLLGTNQANTVFAPSAIGTKIYSFDVYEGSDLVMSLSPHKDDDGVYCLFDNISNTIFYSNVKNGMVPPPSTVRLSVNTINANNKASIETVAITCDTPSPVLRLGQDKLSVDWLSGLIEGSNLKISIQENTTDTPRSGSFDVYEGSSVAHLVVNQEGDIGVNFVSYLYNDSNGQYIDTGIIPTTDTVIELRGYATAGSNSAGLIGTRQSTSLNRFDFIHGDMGSTPAYQYNRFGSVGSKAILTTLEDNAPHVFRLERTELFVDGVIPTDVESNLNASESNICKPTGSFYLFGGNTSGTASNIAGGVYIDYCKIWSGSELVAYYRAALDDNKVPCMYDYVTSTYVYAVGDKRFNHIV